MSLIKRENLRAWSSGVPRAPHVYLPTFAQPVAEESRGLHETVWRDRVSRRLLGEAYQSDEGWYAFGRGLVEAREVAEEVARVRLRLLGYRIEVAS